MTEGLNLRELSVGLVTTSFPLTKASASGVFVERLAAHLSRLMMVRVLVPCPCDSANLKSDETYSVGCFVYGPQRWQRLAHHPGGIPDALRRRDPALLLLPFFVPAMFLACLRLAGRVDVIHGNWSAPALIAAVAAACRKKPAVATLRGEDVNRARASTLFRTVLRMCMRMNQAVVVVSQSMREELKALYPQFAHKILFIPNGVDIVPLKRHGGIRAPMHLLTIGSCIRRKRLDVILRALSEAKLAGKMILRVVGDGAERPRLEQMAQAMNLTHSVEFIGSVPPSQIVNQLQWADVFVFASESEGRPNVILEAMAAGLPIVSSNIAGVAELLPRGIAMLYPVGDHRSLAAHLLALLEDHESVSRYGALARQRIVDLGLTWTNCGAQYASLYKKVCDYGPVLRT